jgi:hypothetical protein
MIPELQPFDYNSRGHAATSTQRDQTVSAMDSFQFVKTRHNKTTS